MKDKLLKSFFIVDNKDFYSSAFYLWGEMIALVSIQFDCEAQVRIEYRPDNNIETIETLVLSVEDVIVLSK
jgi:hypothetical protein